MRLAFFCQRNETDEVFNSFLQSLRMRRYACTIRRGNFRRFEVNIEMRLAEQMLFFEAYNLGQTHSSKRSTESLQTEGFTRTDELGRRGTGDALCRLIAGLDVVAIASRLMVNDSKPLLMLYVAANEDFNEATARLQKIVEAVHDGASRNKMLELVLDWNGRKLDKHINHKRNRFQSWDTLAQGFEDQIRNKVITWPEEKDKKVMLAKLEDFVRAWDRFWNSIMPTVRSAQSGTRALHGKLCISSAALSTSVVFKAFKEMEGLADIAKWVEKLGSYVDAITRLTLRQRKHPVATRVIGVPSNSRKITVRSWTEIAQEHLSKTGQDGCPRLPTEGLEYFLTRAATLDRMKSFRSDSVTLRMHAEMSIIRYFIKNFPDKRIILSVSKRSCVGCTVAMSAIRKDAMIPRPSSAGTHGKCYGRFRNPCFTVEDDSPVSVRIQEALELAWTELARDTERERKRVSTDSMELSPLSSEEELHQQEAITFIESWNAEFAKGS